MINININGKTIRCEDGEQILHIARRENIDIPAICYLTKCTPTLACKLCMVEIDGKRVYSCSTKAKDGMNIITSTPEIESERATILQSYCVNHPLQCGVCDKSGECELQDYTLKFKIQEQEYGVKEVEKEQKSWAKIKYDPYLCILCERCVTTCKDNIGLANLKSVKVELPSIQQYKESMPKDPFSVWSKRQKGLIDFVGENPCFDCGECQSVCPVGALSDQDFQYSANAWELEIHNSTCPHCAMGCLVQYNSRHFNLKGDKRIFRVTNDFHYNPICGAGRYAFDIKSDELCSQNISDVIKNIKQIRAIKIGATSTNEEIALLQKIKNELGIKLYNDQALKLREFMDSYVKVSGGFYKGKTSSIKEAKNIIILGDEPKYTSPALFYEINNALKNNKDTKLVYIHPLRDKTLEKLTKNFIHIQYNPNSFLDVFTQTINAIDESIIKNEGGEISKQIREFILDSQNILIVGHSVYTNDNREDMARSLAKLELKANTKILLNPASTNLIGVALIASLDPQDQSDFVGFRTKGKYTLDCISSDFSIPAHTQIEGTITNIDLRVLPLTPALEHKGKDLGDIGAELGFESEFLVDYTPMLPKEMGYKNIDFDHIKNHYSKSGENERGYILEISKPTKNDVEEILFETHRQDLKFNATSRDAQSQFNHYTAVSKNLQSKIGVYVSEEFLKELNLTNSQGVQLEFLGESVNTNIYIDYDLENGIFALSPILCSFDLPNFFYIDSIKGK